ncbi:hypothetical protein J6590_033649 [Homalodisca vitripennis]|nr:hypothetical protein J6590_033649 [Homalodisca vitripennis]
MEEPFIAVGCHPSKLIPLMEFRTEAIMLSRRALVDSRPNCWFESKGHKSRRAVCGDPARVGLGVNAPITTARSGSPDMRVDKLQLVSLASYTSYARRCAPGPVGDVK